MPTSKGYFEHINPYQGNKSELVTMKYGMQIPWAIRNINQRNANGMPATYLAWWSDHDFINTLQRSTCQILTITIYY